MISIALCDDDHLQLQATKQLINEFIRTEPEYSIKVVHFSSGEELLNYVSVNGPFHIYILDIIMSSINGIETATRLRNAGDQGQIIYLTTSKEYALVSFDTDPTHYLIKPINTAKLFQVLKKAISIYERKRVKSILVKTRDGIVALALDDILYAELTGRNIRYYIYRGNIVESVSLRTTFAESVSTLLQDKRFTLCGASFVVNLFYVSLIQKEKVVLKDKSYFLPPKKAIAGLRTKWLDYWLEEDKQ